MKCLTKNKKKGAITIFASLIMASVILLNSVLIDSARILTAKANLNYKLMLAAKSLLAAFDRVLYEDYGLVAAEEKQDSTLDAEYYFNGHSDEWTDFFSDSKYINLSPLKGTLSGMYTEYKDNLADVNILQEQIINLMQYRSSANLLEYVLEGLNILNSGKNTSEGEALYREACSLLDELSEKADTLYRTVQGWSDNDISCTNGFKNNKNREIVIAKIRTDAFLLQGKLFVDLLTGDNSMTLNNIKTNCLKLKADFETYAQLNRNAIALLSEIAQLRETITPRIQKIKHWADTAIAETEEEQRYIDKLSERILELEAIIRKTEYKGVRSMLDENLEILSDRTEQMRLLYEHVSQQDKNTFSYEFVCDCLQDAECKEMNTEINVYTGEDNVDSSLAEQDPRAEGDTAQSAILKNIEDLPEIDEDLFNSLPSVCNDLAQIDLNDSSLSKNVLVDDYILTYFSNCSSTGYVTRTSFFRAEAEYILNGKSSEEANIEYTLLKIFGFRTGLNLIHVFCDSDKRQMAISIGNAIAGAATCGIGGPLFTALVAAAWAMAEAALDVEALKNGEEVPLIKTSENWKLSIEGIGNTISKDTEEENSDFSLKMDYTGYLRLLLFMTPQKTKLARIQDVIELNLTTLTGKRYYLGNYYCGLKMKCDFEIPTSVSVINITEEINVAY